MTKKNHNSKQDIQLARLEERCKKIDDIDNKVEAILTNHLPHLTTAVAKLDTNQKILLGFMFAIVAALIGLYFNG